MSFMRQKSGHSFTFSIAGPQIMVRLWLGYGLVMLCYGYVMVMVMLWLGYG